MEDSSLQRSGEGDDAASGPVDINNDVIDYRRRSYRTSVEGLCLFCNSKFPRSHPLGSKAINCTNIPKFKRTFAFLAAELGVQILDKKTNSNTTEFTFISEQVPLCSPCLELLGQVNSLFLKQQSIKFQMTSIVGKIRTSIIKSRSSSKPIYTEIELENESHFNAFRRQVEEEDRPQHPCDLKIIVPQIRMERLPKDEVERHMEKLERLKVESEDDVNDLNFCNLIQDIEDSQVFDDGDIDVDYSIGTMDDGEENDVKPDISELDSRIIIMKKRSGAGSNNNIGTETAQLQSEDESYESDASINSTASFSSIPARRPAETDKQIEFIKLLKLFPPLLDKSQVPLALSVKNAAMDQFIKKWAGISGETLSRASLMKKVNNMKTSVKYKADAHRKGTKKVRFLSWEKELLTFWKATFVKKRGAASFIAPTRETGRNEVIPNIGVHTRSSSVRPIPKPPLETDEIVTETDQLEPDESGPLPNPTTPVPIKNRQLSFVKLLKSFPQLLDKSHLPQAISAKNSAMDQFITEWAGISGESWSRAALMKKIGNMKTRVKAKADACQAGNEEIVLLNWEKQLLAFSKSAAVINSEALSSIISAKTKERNKVIPDPPTNPSTSPAVTSSPITQIITAPTPKKKRQRTIYPKAPDEDTCKICNIAFKTQKEFVDHFKAHHPGEFPLHCPEPGCAYAALMPNAIRQHIFKKHSSDEVIDSKKNMVCQECGKRFFSNNNLRHHILMHKGLKPFSCGQCGKKFRCQQAVDVHVFRVHENVRNFHCPHCPWKFKDHVSLRGHIAIHTGEKKHSCHICIDRKFIQLHALKSHWNVHKKKGDWTEPPGFNKRRRGWSIKKGRQNFAHASAPNEPAQQNQQEQAHSL